jgi:hypothetical protein
MLLNTPRSRSGTMSETTMYVREATLPPPTPWIATDLVKIHSSEGQLIHKPRPMMRTSMLFASAHTRLPAARAKRAARSVFLRPSDYESVSM